MHPGKKKKKHLAIYNHESVLDENTPYPSHRQRGAQDL